MDEFLNLIRNTKEMEIFQWDIVCSEAIKSFCHTEDQEVNEIYAEHIVKGLLASSNCKRTLAAWEEVLNNSHKKPAL